MSLSLFLSHSLCHSLSLSRSLCHSLCLALSHTPTLSLYLSLTRPLSRIILPLSFSVSVSRGHARARLISLSSLVFSFSRCLVLALFYLHLGGSRALEETTFIALMEEPTRFLVSCFAAVHITKSANWRKHWLMTKVLHKSLSCITKVRLYKRFPVLIQDSGPRDLIPEKIPAFEMTKYGKTGSLGGILKVAVIRK